MSSTQSAFLRIYIGSSTAVVEKKSLPLRDALASKLKSRNLEVDKCIAYIKESCVKVEWDRDVSKISADNIVVAELSDEIQHSFVSASIFQFIYTVKIQIEENHYFLCLLSTVKIPFLYGKNEIF